MAWKTMVADFRQQSASDWRQWIGTAVGYHKINYGFNKVDDTHLSAGNAILGGLFCEWSGGNVTTPSQSGKWVSIEVTQSDSNNPAQPGSVNAQIVCTDEKPSDVGATTQRTYYGYLYDNTGKDIRNFDEKILNGKKWSQRNSNREKTLTLTTDDIKNTSGTSTTALVADLQEQINNLETGGESSNFYDKYEMDSHFVRKLNIKNLMQSYSTESNLAKLLFKVNADVDSYKATHQAGASDRIEKYAYFNGNATGAEGQVRQLIFDLLGQSSTRTGRLHLSWKSSIASGWASLEELTITYEGSNTEVYKYYTNNFSAWTGGVPSVNEDYIRKEILDVKDIRQDGVSLTSERNRTWTAWSGASYMNDGQTVTLNLKGYNISQIEEVVLTWSNYDIANKTPLNTNTKTCIKKNYKNDTTNSYDAFYDTEVFVQPWTINEANEGIYHMFARGFNIDNKGVINGTATTHFNNDSVGYVLRSVFVTVSGDQWGNPLGQSLSAPVPQLQAQENELQERLTTRYQKGL